MLIGSAASRVVNEAGPPSLAKNPIRIAFYNHKGGVGKTTLAMNTAAALAEMNRTVLLVDADPQCNLTAYLIEEQVLNDLLDNSDTAEGETLWTSLRPIVEAQGEPTVANPIGFGIDRMFLLPGDIRLSEFERHLEDFIADAFKRRLKGFRATSALSSVVSRAAKDVNADYVFFDTGPNIGRLNEIVLMGADYFVVPCAFDLFSLRAIKSVGRTIADWIEDWETVADIAPDNAPVLRASPKFLGCVPQRFRTYGGEIAGAARTFQSRIDRSVKADIVEVFKRVRPDLVSSGATTLGVVKDFASLVPLSHQQGVPLWEVSSPHASATLKQQAQKAFADLAKAIDSRCRANRG